MKVISTGIPSLDAATGIGGYPRGCVVEVYGKYSVGKTALMIYGMAEVHKKGGHTYLCNVESLIAQETWLDWANSIAPPGWDPSKLIISNPPAHGVAIQKYGEALESGMFDMLVFDSIGALSTENELKTKESKQAYGQSGMVTQLVKQAMHYASGRNKKGNLMVPIFLNQIRDEAGFKPGLVNEKAPGGRAKEHGATIRVHLKSHSLMIDNKKSEDGFIVGAVLTKNKVGAPRVKTNWTFWDRPSPDGVVGIDVFSNGVDTFLQQGVLPKSGSWYVHDKFPGGKVNGGPAVVSELRNNPMLFEELRREAVLEAYRKSGDVLQVAEEVAA